MTLSRTQVQDLDTMRALAHPLRMRLLGLLRADGPATASELGRRVGESSGSTSYHLRQLERFGFVEDAPDQPSRRSRVWRASADVTSWSEELFEGPGGDEVFAAVRSGQLEHLRRSLVGWTRPERGIGASDYLLHLDPDDLDALNGELHDVVARYVGRAGTREVALHVLALPYPRESA